MFSSRIQLGHGQNKLTTMYRQLMHARQPILNLVQSNPSACGLSPPGVLESLAQPASLRYEPDCRGALASRQALADWLGCTADRLFLSASTSEAYSWLFKLLCDPGDSVLVPRPGYPLFDYLAGLEAVHSRPYRLEYRHPDGWRIDRDSLDLTDPAVQALVLIHPNNPTGSYIREEERSWLLTECARHRVAIIADEVFLPYSLDSEGGQRSFADSQTGLVFCLNGLSKLLCLPQLKLGWIQAAGQPDLIAAAMDGLEIIADTYLSVGAVPMHALPSLLPKADDFTAGVRDRLRANLEAARRVFAAADSPIRILRCEGGWTLLLSVPRYLDDEALALGLLREAGVLVHPGYFFDCEEDGILALSLIVPEPEFKDGCARIAAWFTRVGQTGPEESIGP